MATETAERVLLQGLSELCLPYRHDPKLLIVQRFPETQRVDPSTLPDFDALIDTHYDSENETTSTALGGTDLKYGLPGVLLPLVLSHNTPNNSLGLLWAEGSRMKPLFPVSLATRIYERAPKSIPAPSFRGDRVRHHFFKAVWSRHARIAAKWAASLGQASGFPQRSRSRQKLTTPPFYSFSPLDTPFLSAK